MSNWVIESIRASGYVGIILLMMVENIFPPIPSEVIMPLAGYLVTEGKLTFLGVTLAGMVGSVLGALPLYYLGYKIGHDRVYQLAEKHGYWLTVSKRDLEKANDWFHRYGGWAVFLCRLVPGIRSLISIPAGLAEMNMWKFLFYTSLGTAIWAAFLAGLGYWLGEQFEQVGEYLSPVSWVVIGGITIWYVYRLITQRKKAKQNT